MNAITPDLSARRRPGRSSAPRVALVHYWLIAMRGGERVLERLLSLYPDADIFTHVYDPAAVSAAIRARKVTTSFIQNLPGSRRHYQKYLPLMPMALEQLDLRGYDLVISSESGPAKGVIVPPAATHVCYCHSPMRYLWDHYHDYRASAGAAARASMPLLFPSLRMWDFASAARVDGFMANSNFIRQRIAKAFRRDASVVFPPVDVSLYQPSAEPQDFYLWVGQMTAYKRPDLAVEAFNRLRLPLMMVGAGEMAAEVRRLAGPTIKIVDKLPFDELRRAYADCQALIFTAEEDFGIVPVEAMASGRPVIAYGSGGAMDTVLPHETGLHFDSQTVEALIGAVEEFQRWAPQFDPARARANARRFSPEQFDRGVLRAVAHHQAAVGATPAAEAVA